MRYVHWTSLLVVLFLSSCTGKALDENQTHSSAEQSDSAVINEQASLSEDSIDSNELLGADTEEQEIKFDISYIMGKFNPAEHADFSKIELQYADREGLYMRTDAYESFIKMYDAAALEGIQFQIRSAARNFDYQKSIWERKWNGETKIENGKDASSAYPEPTDRAKMILLYSSMPGTSRHHWGTDIDLNSFDNEWFASGTGAKLYEWMGQHAHEYGYCQPYTDKLDGRTGYEEERWHWTYMPISKILTRQASALLKNEMISGFEGAEVAKEVDMLNNYVLGIHTDCN